MLVNYLYGETEYSAGHASTLPFQDARSSQQSAPQSLRASRAHRASQAHPAQPGAAPGEAARTGRSWMLCVLVRPASHTHNDLRRVAAIRLLGQIRAMRWRVGEAPVLRLFLGPSEPMPDMYQKACQSMPATLECALVPGQRLSPAAVVEHVLSYTANGTGLLLLDDSKRLRSNFVARLHALDQSRVHCLLWHPANSTVCPGFAFLIPARLIHRFRSTQNASDISEIAARENVYAGSVPLVSPIVT